MQRSPWRMPLRVIAYREGKHEPVKGNDWDEMNERVGESLGAANNGICFRRELNENMINALVRGSRFSRPAHFLFWLK